MLAYQSNQGTTAYVSSLLSLLVLLNGGYDIYMTFSASKRLPCMIKVLYTEAITHTHQMDYLIDKEIVNEISEIIVYSR